jgi:flagellar basal body rod protein FlgG
MAVGTSMYIPKDVTTNPELRAQKFVVQQGTVELSNASVINEMINSIKISRNYETLSSFVKEKSNQLSRAISLGRVNN